jgi:hypothetical protein
MMLWHWCLCAMPQLSHVLSGSTYEPMNRWGGSLTSVGGSPRSLVVAPAESLFRHLALHPSPLQFGDLRDAYAHRFASSDSDRMRRAASR